MARVTYSMVFAIVNRNADVLHAVTGKRAIVQYQANAFLHRWNELIGDCAAVDFVDKFDTAAAR